MQLPYRAGLIPPRAAAFQNRDATRLVEQAADHGDTVVLTSDATTSVLSGLGGVGKTQLAIDYAEALWAAHELDLLVWVTAGAREAIVSTYANVGEAVIGIQAGSPEDGTRRLLEWLSTTTARWLVVLDDLQAPDHLNGLWPPSTSTGRVLVTTRRRDASLRGHRRRVIAVDVFTPEEADAYLASAFSDQPALLDGTDELGVELGFLPLALAQASAYALDRGLSCADYLARFADRQRKLSTVLPQSDRDGLPDGHQATVAATWSLSIDLADNLTPVGLAGPLLEIASVLDANGIPATVFTADATVRMLTTRVERTVTPEEARDGLGCLHRLSLITLDPTSTARSVRVHALVQRAVRDTITAATMPAVATAAADALLEAWPEIERDTTFAQVLRTNVETLAIVAEQHLWSSEGHPVLFRAGTSLGESGLVGEASNYFHQLYRTADERLGPDHPDTLITRAYIAYWHGRAGDPTGAATAFEQLLTDYLRVLGPDHPDTLSTRADIAYYRGEAGDPAGAATAFEQLLTDRLRVLGPDHPQTLITRADIASWRGEAGDPAGAATAFEQLLTDRLRVLGPDHPHTLNTRSYIAYWHGEAGDPAGAATAFEQLLTDYLRALGPDHPDTLSTRSHIARYRGEAGDPTGAATAFEQLLTDRLRVLGPDHPHTLNTRSHIARYRGEAGDPTGATTAFEQLLTDRLRVLGPDHPRTLITRTHIAYWQAQSDAKQE